MQDALIDTAARVVGLYHDGRQIAFTRTLSDGHAQSYLADVYVLEEHRGRGLGVALVRFSVDEGPLAATKWFLHTADAHDLYRNRRAWRQGARALEPLGRHRDRELERLGYPPHLRVVRYDGLELVSELECRGEVNCVETAERTLKLTREVEQFVVELDQVDPVEQPTCASYRIDSTR